MNQNNETDELFDDFLAKTHTLLPKGKYVDWDVLVVDNIELFHKALDHLITQRVRETLEKIGEPMLNDFEYSPTAEEYEWAIKVVKWYKDRIESLRKVVQDVHTA